jgi:hypothetical protein
LHRVRSRLLGVPAIYARTGKVQLAARGTMAKTEAVEEVSSTTR